MTNYEKWNQWDADEETEKIASREGADQLEQNASKHEKVYLAQLGRMNDQTKQVAEAFRSQTAVDALKAKGSMRNRRKRGSTTSSDQTGNVEKKSEVLSTASLPHSPNEQLMEHSTSGVADALPAFSSSLSSIVARNTALLKLMNTNQLEEGYTAGMQLLRELQSLEASLGHLYLCLGRASGQTGDSLQLVHENIADSRVAIQEIMANATSTLTLCAAATGEHAVAVDMARCHLKMFEGEGGGSSSGHDHSHSHDQSHSHDHSHSGKGQGKVPDRDARPSLVAMWLLRGQCFAALGSAYLANVHFRHVKALQPSFPGIAAMLRLLDAADVQESLMRSETSMEGLIVRKINHVLASQEVAAKKTSFAKGDLFFSEKIMEHLTFHLKLSLTPPCAVGGGAVIPEQADDSDHPLHVDGGLSAQSSSRRAEESGRMGDLRAALAQLPSVLADLVSSSSPESGEGGGVVMVLLVNNLARKLFYAGQMLYLEGFFRSSEVEYWACMCLLHTVVVLSSSKQSAGEETLSVDELTYIRTLYACCLLNVAAARVSRPAAGKGALSSTPASDERATPVAETGDCHSTRLAAVLLSVPETMLLTPLQLCDYSLSLRRDPVAEMRRIFVLEKLQLWNEAYTSVDRLSETSSSALLSSYVIDHGDRLVFSQKFTGGVTDSAGGLPFMDSRPAEEVSTSFREFISRKKSELVGKMGRSSVK